MKLALLERSLRKVNLATIAIVSMFIFALVMGGTATYVYASNTSNFTQTIGVGSLSVDIVDASYVTVASPTIAMGAYTFNFACTASTGTFGTATEQIYVQNPDAADGGWDVTLAASATSAVWTSAGTDYDFNDPTSSGCTDGADAGDAVGGQMTVDASAATLDVGQCATCTTTSVTRGSSDAFDEGVTDDITILSGAIGSDDIGDWTLETISISQTIPAEQPAAADYDIDMVLSIAAI